MSSSKELTKQQLVNLIFETNEELFKDLKFQEQNDIIFEVCGLIFKLSTLDSDMVVEIYRTFIEDKYPSYTINLMYLFDLRRFNSQVYQELVWQALNKNRDQLFETYLEYPEIKEFATEELRFYNIFWFYFNNLLILEDIRPYSNSLEKFIKIGQKYYRYQEDLFLRMLKILLQKKKIDLGLVALIPDNDPQLAEYVIISVFESITWKSDVEMFFKKDYFWTLTLENYLKISDELIRAKLFDMLPVLFFELQDHKLGAMAVAILERIFAVDIPKEKEDDSVSYVMDQDATSHYDVFIAFLTNPKVIIKVSRRKNIQELYRQIMTNSDVSVQQKIRLFTGFLFSENRNIRAFLGYEKTPLALWIPLESLPEELHQYICLTSIASSTILPMVDVYRAQRAILKLIDTNPLFADISPGFTLGNIFLHVGSNNRNPNERYVIMKQCQVIDRQIFGFHTGSCYRFVVADLETGYYEYACPIASENVGNYYQSRAYQVTSDAIYLVTGDVLLIISRDLRKVLRQQSLEEIIPSKIVSQFVVTTSSLIFLSETDVYIYDFDLKLKDKLKWESTKFAVPTRNGFYSTHQRTVEYLTEEGLSVFEIDIYNDIPIPIIRNGILYFSTKAPKMEMIAFDLEQKKVIQKYSVSESRSHLIYSVSNTHLVTVQNNTISIFQLGSNGVPIKVDFKLMESDSPAKLVMNLSQFHFCTTQDRVLTYNYSGKLLGNQQFGEKLFAEVNNFFYTSR